MVYFTETRINNDVYALNNHYYRPHTNLRKGIVFRSMCQEFCLQGGHVWQGGMHGQGACVTGVGGGHAWQGWGACMAGGHAWWGCAWWGGGMCGKGGHAW